MIVTEVFYGVKCNRCGEINSDGEYSYWNDESGAEESAMESEWIEEKGKHFCPNCYEYNEDKDENLPKQDFPDHVKLLQKFLQKMIRGYGQDVFEEETTFSLKAQIFNAKTLTAYEENYIKEMLGEKFVSLNYQEQKFSNGCCVITVLKQ